MLSENVAGKFTTKQSGQVSQRATALGSVAGAQVEPPNFEMSRAGRRFILGNSAAITGIAPVQALPTTGAQWVIWNPSTTRTLAMEQVAMYLTSGTPGVGGILLAALFTLPASVGATYTGSSISSASIGSGASATILKASVTVTAPAAPNWFTLASNPGPNVTAFASSTFLENRLLGGSVLVPPLCGLALAVVSPAGTTPLFAPAAMWVEIECDLE